ncbi:putative HNH nuclease domain-containing protein [Seiridium cardinale]
MAASKAPTSSPANYEITPQPGDQPPTYEDRAVKDCPPYWCESMSRKTVGDVGLKVETRFLNNKPDFKVLRVKREGGQSGKPVFLKTPKQGENLVLFEISWRKKDNLHIWLGESGGGVAIERASDTVHKLELTKELKQQLADKLVASWCLKIWHASAAKQEKERLHEGLEGE